MGVQSFLKNIPKNIRLPLNPQIVRYARGHDMILCSVGYTFVLWLLLIPVSKFPITFGFSHVESLALPDYGTGNTYTVFKTKTRSYDFI